MPELLIELLSEEIPARMQGRAAEDLKRLVTDGLKAAGLEFDSAEAYATPRRLTLVVDGLPEKQPDIREERRGPRADAPEKAVAGFKGSLPEGTPVEVRGTDKGTFLYAVIEKTGAATKDVVPFVVRDAIWDISWPKSMRWSDDRIFKWVRPLEGILCVFDGEVLEFGLQRGIGRARVGVDLVTGAYEPHGGSLLAKATKGHRFLAPDPVEVTGFADYRAKLLAAKVMLDPAERRSKIDSDLTARAAGEGLTVRTDPGLLDEVAGLVEWPVVLLGSIDRQFMDVPEEVLITSMRAHQKYFSLLDPDGSLAPRFGLVANMETADGGAAIVAGNERVLRARLSDAKFFWDQDRRQPLAARTPSLKGMIFHAKLGTLADKVERIEALAAEIAGWVPGADRDLVRSAAQLAKADLVTGMVGEFPELQGVMGRYYARHDGEHDAVADAIAEHYAPQGPNDRCPSAPVSVCVALADKIDTLVGFWAIDEKPTGSRDPYALRRAALGVIRLIVENRLRLPLMAAFDQAASLHGVAGKGFDAPDLLAFFADRLKVHLRERGVRHDLVSAVFALLGEDDLVRLLARVDALKDFLAGEDGANLLTAYRRAANIVAIEEKKDSRRYDDAPRPDRLSLDEERRLFEYLGSTMDGVRNAISTENYAEALRAMSALRRPVDEFFDKVTVNTDEPEIRANRLCLLAQFGATLDQIADFSQIEG